MNGISTTRIYFLRHGLADRSAWDGSEFDRPLTPTGHRRMELEAASLARMNLRIDLILTSPLVRARQTAEIVAETLDLGDRLQLERQLALGFGSAELEDILAAHPEARHPLLVGHEPDFSETISAITGGSHVVCKKGSLARVDLLSHDPLIGELVWLIPPKALAL